MDSKPGPGGVFGWWKKFTASETSDNPRVCEKGHPMDPNWKTCAYCDAENRAHQKTGQEASQPVSSEPLQRSTTMERTTTKVEGGIPEEGQGETKFDASDFNTHEDIQPRKRKPQAHQRKLTGVLVTFKWRPQGELFPLYEGRNVIGSGEASDVYVTTDRMMSSEHAVILCRAGRDELHDMLSTNGTFLNEKYVERDGADLIDGALIKTGATIFEFRKFTSGGERRPEGQRTGYYEDEGDTGRSRSQGETSI
ncbi:MAG TPA: FHA domain-containing protein [Nitrosospira sp.]|jgi:hypothetical protein